MRKGIKNAVFVICAMFLAGCLFYCMIAGAGPGKGALAYVIMAAVMAVTISVTICAGIRYIQKLQDQLKELKELQDRK